MQKNDFKKYKDNPNPAANIGFVSYLPLNFYVYKNIYKHLPNAEFIVGEEYDIKRVGQNSNYLEDLVNFFSKQKVYWRFYNSQDPKLTKSEFYSKYALLVSLWYTRPPMSEPYNKDKKLVRVMYGHAKDPWNFGPWSAYFDLVLSYGQYSQKFLSVYGNSEVVGNPKFDDWFSDNINQIEINNLRQILDPAKKTILYLPTYGSLSSLDLMSHGFNALSNQYNIILRPHHNSVLYEQDWLEPYKQNHRIIIRGNQDDILPLLKMADFVVSDNSGAIFDVVLADKPIILIDFLDENFFETYKETLYCRLAKKGTVGVVTSETSLEQIIKLPGNEIGPVVKIPQTRPGSQKKQVAERRLQEALNSAIEKESIFSLRRKKIRELAFSYNDGQCGKRAAEKIQDLLYKPKLGPNFMAEALDRYYDHFITQRTGRGQPGFWHSKRGRKEAARRYLKIRSLPFWPRVKIIIEQFFNKESIK